MAQTTLEQRYEIASLHNLGNTQEYIADIIGLHKSGRSRIVLKIFEHGGYKVNKLDRVIFAELTNKNLPRGRWRGLTNLEVNNI
ncbi:MAG: 16S rRNA U516 pseudouridylate synthase RsuA-like enzyme [Polaribacter sp.]|jgi:16S rRNA U516 pseudouridylate synthase RsuA-like enzyme